MQCEHFIPNHGESKLLGLRSFWWIYGRGGDIIDRFGNKFNRQLLPNNEYFGMYIGDELDETKLSEFMVYANRWGDVENSSKVVKKFIEADGWKYANRDRGSTGRPVLIKGHRCINSFPFDVKCAVVYDLELEDIVIIPSYTFRLNNKAADLFKKVIDTYGELYDCYDVKVLLEWKPLNVFPCNEYAYIASAECCFAKGYQINKLIDEAERNNQLYNIAGEYMCIRLAGTGETQSKLFVVSNKWNYKTHVKTEPWMKENNSIIKMWRDTTYSGRVCVINEHKCIIVYPFNIYNPVIWDVEENVAFVMPSKEYVGDRYYEKIKEYFGYLPMYTNKNGKG